MTMLRTIFAVAILAATAAAAPKWVRVTAPHFVVTSDGSLSDARHVAGQLERMREVFHQAFPGLRDPAAPLEVLAVANRKEFEALEPAGYLGKGKLELAGYFQRAQEHNLILLRLDATDADHPYRVVYHEYTHLMTLGGGQIMPVWLSEGLAQFYESTEVSGNSASIGKYEDFNIELLRQHPLMPLATLFAVGPDSPYYHEQNKADVFYAESWALTHMLLMRQRQRNAHEIQDYLALLRQNLDSAAAAARAFGSLADLQQQLDQYTRHQSYTYVILKLSGKVDDSQFAAAGIPPAVADAERGEFLAYVGRGSEAAALLQQVLAAGASNAAAAVSADETLGYLAAQQDHLAEAAHWYGLAVAGNSTSFLAHYDFAAITLRQGGEALDAPTAARVEASLRTAIQINPDFAPAYASLAQLKAQRAAGQAGASRGADPRGPAPINESLDEAYALELKAISLQPNTFNYRFNAASILSQQNRVPDAIAVLQRALPLATSPAERAMAEQRIASEQEYQTRLDAYNRARGQGPAQVAEAPVAAPPAIARRAAPEAAAPEQAVSGAITAVRCAGAALDLDLRGSAGTLTLHAADFAKVPMGTDNFDLPAGFNPCHDLVGLRATAREAAGALLALIVAK